MGQLLFINASQVVTCAGPGRGRRGGEMSDAKARRGDAVAVDGQRIAAVGPADDLKRAYPAAELIDCAGLVITPGLVS